MMRDARAEGVRLLRVSLSSFTSSLFARESSFADSVSFTGRAGRTPQGRGGAQEAAPGPLGPRQGYERRRWRRWRCSCNCGDKCGANCGDTCGTICADNCADDGADNCSASVNFEGQLVGTAQAAVFDVGGLPAFTYSYGGVIWSLFRFRALHRRDGLARKHRHCWRAVGTFGERARWVRRTVERTVNTDSNTMKTQLGNACM